MYGEVTQTIASQSADFGYAGMYYHAPSGLNLATYRAYSPSLGRWINRDPAGMVAGPNLYAYVGNRPIIYSDPDGLKGKLTICALPEGDGSQCGCEPGHVWLSWQQDDEPNFIGPVPNLVSRTYGTWQGKGLVAGGPEEGYTSGRPNQGGYCKTIMVDDAHQVALMHYIAAIASEGESGWKFPRGSCVQFANNGWNVAGGPNLGLNGSSGPGGAAGAIQGAGGTAF